MKITDITWEKLRLDMTEPFVIAFSEISYTELIVIKVTTDVGLVGYGEAAPFTPVTGETPESVIAILEMLRPGLIGVDPFRIEYIHSMMDHFVYGNGSAKCAIDLAMYDLMGKACGQPVYKLLGGYGCEVLSDFTISIGAPEAMAEAAERKVKVDGFSVLKVKTGIDPESDIRALQLIREKVGPAVHLRVDANQGYNVNSALYAIEGFKRAGVESVEQCLPYWDRVGMGVLRSKVSGMILMLDETVHDVKDAAEAIRGGYADMINIKLMKCGGLLPGTKICDVAEASGVNCMVGCMQESNLAITAALSLVAARKNVTEADCDGSLLFKDDGGIAGGFTRQGGLFKLLDRPGLGVELSF